MSLEIVILAAGSGSRMKSNLPKPLHKLAGKSLLSHVLEAAHSLEPSVVHVIVGYGAEQLRETFIDHDINWIEQKEQLGTGHALQQVLPHLDNAQQVLVLSADVPLISQSTLRDLIEQHADSDLSLLTADFDDPSGLGRVVRNDADNIIAIIEERDASGEERGIHEIYSGIMLASMPCLKKYLPTLSNDNSQGEYYLTELIEKVVADEMIISSVFAACPEEVMGINDRSQLALLERFYQECVAEAYMDMGVSFADPARFDLRGSLDAAQDVFIDINVICEGEVSLGANTHIGANCVLRDVKISDNVIIKENSIIEGAVIESHCVVGPFARIRPGTFLATGARVGNFVEIKKSDIGEGSKVNHLSYIGDCSIGSAVNIGAGTITCNYDGVNKHRTVIGDGAFIGSNTQLVAPVTVGKGAIIGAGSTISKDAPAEELTLSRSQQKTVVGWKKRNKD